jgi:hypothetical protein
MKITLNDKEYEIIENDDLDITAYFTDPATGHRREVKNLNTLALLRPHRPVYQHKDWG